MIRAIAEWAVLDLLADTKRLPTGLRRLIFHRSDRCAFLRAIAKRRALAAPVGAPIDSFYLSSSSE